MLLKGAVTHADITLLLQVLGLAVLALSRVLLTEHLHQADLSMLAQRVVTARVLLSSVVHLHPNLFGLTLT